MGMGPYPRIRFTTQHGTAEMYIVKEEDAAGIETESGKPVHEGDLIVGFEEGTTMSLHYEDAIESDPDDEALIEFMRAAEKYMVALIV